jgi:hypothetical protein
MTTVEQILKKPIVRKYIKSIKELNKLESKSFDHTHPLVGSAVELALKMKPIELLIIDWKNPELTANSAYVTCLASEDLMFDVAYLMSVTGTTPNGMTDHWGLKEKDIKEYQQQWREVGIDPSEIQEKDWTTLDDYWKS